MGQVPRQALPFGVVGGGRAARHICRYIELLGLPYRQWSRKESRDASAVLRGCDPVLILISDDAIEPFIRSHAFLEGKRLLHFSGSLVSALAPSAHPLMTFTDEPYNLDVYQEMVFILEKGRGTLNELLPGLPNRHFYIDPELKPLYHSLCVMSGNFTGLLWKKLFDGLDGRLSIPPDAAYPYLRQICRNLAGESTRPLSGPLTRGDTETLQRDIDALKGDPFQDVFKAFVKAYEQEAS